MSARIARRGTTGHGPILQSAVDAGEIVFPHVPSCHPVDVEYPLMVVHFALEQASVDRVDDDVFERSYRLYVEGGKELVVV